MTTDNVENAIVFAAERVSQSICNMICNMDRPSVRMRPRLSLDGNKWIACYGDNLQEGVVGVGESPGEAMYHFDCEWDKRIPEMHRHIGPDRACGQCGEDLTHSSHLVAATK